MSWFPTSIPEQRERFALTALTLSQPFAATCIKFGISRKTGYKWLKRFRLKGASGLSDVSRRPLAKSSPNAALWLERLIGLRRARPHWGAKKLHELLRRGYPHKHLPAVRTLGRWLEQHSLSTKRARKTRRGPSLPHPGLTTAKRAHQVWTLDFKGWFCTADGQRQEPLTVRDAKSRYLLDIRLLANQSDLSVRAALTRIFKREGLPTAIRVDNGAPFAGNGALGLSRLSVWWLRLGIRVEFTRRARPGDNAAHEQMHARFKAEVLKRVQRNRRSAQRRSDEWRKDYNHHRPHEGLSQRTPASCYQRSARKLPPSLKALSHAKGSIVRRVRNRGHIKWKGQKRFIGRAFVGEQIALKSIGGTHHEVYLGPLLIGELHPQDPIGMRPAYWKRHASTPLKV